MLIKYFHLNFIFLCLLGLSFSISANESGYSPLITGSGKIITYNKKLPKISKIEINSSAELYIYQTRSQNEIIIEAENNIFPYLLDEIEGQTLKLSNKHDNIKPSIPIKYTLKINHLQNISASKGANVICQNGLIQEMLIVNLKDNAFANLWFTGDKLTATLSEASQLTVGGQAKDQDIRINGYSNFNGMQLHGNKGLVNISNSGFGLLNIAKTLDISILNDGKVHYIGEPIIKINKSKLSQVSKFQ